MKKRSFAAIGTVILTLSAVMLVGFVWHNQAQTRAGTAMTELTKVIFETQPTTAPPAGPTLPLMDFSGLLKQNPDIIGRLVIEGIELDLPLVQGTDNSYYLNHTAERKLDDRGALFLDYRLEPDFSEFKSIIYGHYKKTGEMFGKLKLLREKSGFERVTEGMLYTPGRTYRLEIFASVLTHATSEMYHWIFFSQVSREKHLEIIREQAVCYRDIGITHEDRLVLLSTCSYEFKDARTVIIARLV